VRTTGGGGANAPRSTEKKGIVREGSDCAVGGARWGKGGKNDFSRRPPNCAADLLKQGFRGSNLTRCGVEHRKSHSATRKRKSTQKSVRHGESEGQDEVTAELPERKGCSWSDGASEIGVVTCKKKAKG